MPPLPRSLGSVLGLLVLATAPPVAAQTVTIRPSFVLAVDNSTSMNTSTGTGINSCGYSRTRINDVGCVIRNSMDALGDATFGLATFNFGCRESATPYYPNGISGCGTGTCPSATAAPAPTAFPSLPYPSFYGCADA